MTTTIYHNPRCSKSRMTLALLRENGVEPDIIRYLDAPPSVAVLKKIAAMMKGPVRDIVRDGESRYRELGLDDDTGDDALLDAVAANPVLLQRPIVVRAGKATVGRPPENILTLL